MKFKQYDAYIKNIGYKPKPKLFVAKSIANAQELAKNRWNTHVHDFQNPRGILRILNDMLSYSDKKRAITYRTLELMFELIKSVKWFHYDMWHNEVILVPRKTSPKR
jgi:hypothetical protein